MNMNRRLSAPDSSLNAPLKSEGESEWQDWLVDDTLDQETRMAETEELGERKELLSAALGELTEREREILAARRLQVHRNWKESEPAPVLEIPKLSDHIGEFMHRGFRRLIAVLAKRFEVPFQRVFAHGQGFLERAAA